MTTRPSRKAPSSLLAATKASTARIRSSPRLNGPKNPPAPGDSVVGVAEVETLVTAAVESGSNSGSNATSNGVDFTARVDDNAPGDCATIKPAPSDPRSSPAPAVASNVSRPMPKVSSTVGAGALPAPATATTPAFLSAAGVSPAATVANASEPASVGVGVGPPDIGVNAGTSDRTSGEDVSAACAQAKEATASHAAVVNVSSATANASDVAPPAAATEDTAPVASRVMAVTDAQATDALAAEALDAAEGAFPTVDGAIEAGLDSVTPSGFDSCVSTADSAEQKPGFQTASKAPLLCTHKAPLQLQSSPLL